MIDNCMWRVAVGTYGSYPFLKCTLATLETPYQRHGASIFRQDLSLYVYKYEHVYV